MSVTVTLRLRHIYAKTSEVEKGIRPARKIIALIFPKVVWRSGAFASEAADRLSAVGAIM